MRERAGDDRLTAMGGLLQSWSEVDPDGAGLTCAAVVSKIDALPIGHGLHDTLLVLAGSKPADGKADKRATSLGYRVRQIVGRIMAGRRLVQAGVSTGVKRWTVETIDKPDPTRNASGDGGHSGDAPYYPARKGEREERQELAPRDGYGEVAGNIATIDPIDTTTPATWTYSRADLGGIF
jgi:hypothetical protein